MHHALELLRSVEVLLLLEQKHVTCYWDTTNGLAMRSVDSQSVLSRPLAQLGYSRIGKWDAFIVSEVSTIVLALSSLYSS